MRFEIEKFCTKLLKSASEYTLKPIWVNELHYGLEVSIIHQPFTRPMIIHSPISAEISQMCDRTHKHTHTLRRIIPEICEPSPHDLRFHCSYVCLNVALCRSLPRIMWPIYYTDDRRSSLQYEKKNTNTHLARSLTLAIYESCIVYYILCNVWLRCAVWMYTLLCIFTALIYGMRLIYLWCEARRGISRSIVWNCAVRSTGRATCICQKKHRAQPYS